jgi:hypothetical protein
VQLTALLEKLFQLAREHDHVAAPSPVAHRDAAGAQPQRSARAIHRRVAAADHYHAPADFASPQLVHLQQEI